MTHSRQRANRAHTWDWIQARALCLREAQRVLGRSTSAEDAAQEAVIRAWRQKDACRTPQRPAPWLTTIARREAWRLLERPAIEEELRAEVSCASTGP